MAFLHGVETIEIEQGSRPINIIKSGVIGLVGIAPKGPQNQVVMINSLREAAVFGSQLSGFNIPQSLEVAFMQGAGTILVVNVFDPAKHTVPVAEELQTVKDGKLKLAYQPIDSVTMQGQDPNFPSLLKDKDYSIDDYGNFKVLNNTIYEGTHLKFSYNRLDVTRLTSTDLLGNYFDWSNTRTGMKCFDLAYNTFGFNPKIFIAPCFSSLTAVAAGLAGCAEKFRGITYLDAPAGMTIPGVVSGRGPWGWFGFNTGNKRVELCYPHLKKYDPASNDYLDFPYSAFLAGLRSALDSSDGFWVSSSNKEIKGTNAAEINLSSSHTDGNSDTNILNQAGITTVFNTFGTGIRTWGNRNASYPQNTKADNFTNIVRIDDVVTESLEQAALQFIDKPINQGLIDSICESGNAFIRVLIGRGALLPGSKMSYHKQDNPPEELANGHLTFERLYMGPTPAERITFKSVLDINLLNTLA